MNIKRCAEYLLRTNKDKRGPGQPERRWELGRTGSCGTATGRRWIIYSTSVCLHVSTSGPRAGTRRGPVGSSRVICSVGSAFTFEGIGRWQVRFLHTAPPRSASCCRCCDGCRWTCVNRSELRPLGGGRVAGRKGRRLPGSLPSFFINGSAGWKLRSGRLSRSLLRSRLLLGMFGGVSSSE